MLLSWDLMRTFLFCANPFLSGKKLDGHLRWPSLEKLVSVVNMTRFPIK